MKWFPLKAPVGLEQMLDEPPVLDLQASTNNGNVHASYLTLRTAPGQNSGLTSEFWWDGWGNFCASEFTRTKLTG